MTKKTDKKVPETTTNVHVSKAGDLRFSLSHVYEMMPNKDADQFFRQNAGNDRYLWNKIIEYNEKEYAENPENGFIGKDPEKGFQKMLTKWRSDEETPWLGEMPVMA